MTESKWQPIETAPKDGTVILVVNGNSHGFYTEPHQIGTAYWGEQAFSTAVPSWCANDCCDGVTTYAPTHWMPLPTSPEGE